MGGPGGGIGATPAVATPHSEGNVAAELHTTTDNGTIEAELEMANGTLEADQFENECEGVQHFGSRTSCRSSRTTSR